ncbi:MAG: transporter permease, partial [Devosia sp.]|nr:transporter permease [Devosia sp.]
MTEVTVATKPVLQGKSGFSALLSMLWRDKLAFVSAVILVLIILCAVLGPALLGDMANSQNLRGRNSPPFDLARGWAFV